MGKLDEMRRDAGANVGESMGQGRERSVPAAMTSTMPARLQGIAKSKSAAEIPVEKIDRDPGQPREEFEPEALQRLADSLKSRGQLQPIRVRWDETASVYRVMMGERRWRAARMAGLASLTCIIHEGAISPAELLADQVIENALREDLQPIEQAKAFKALMTLNGWSGNQLSKELAVSQTTVVRTLGLLDLAPVVQEHVTAGTITPTVAYEVSRVADPEAQRELAEKVVAENLGRAETMELVLKAGAKSTKPKGRGAKAGPSKPFTRRTDLGKLTIELKRHATKREVGEYLSRLAMEILDECVAAESGQSEAA